MSEQVLSDVRCHLETCLIEGKLSYISSDHSSYAYSYKQKYQHGQQIYLSSHYYIIYYTLCNLRRNHVQYLIYEQAC